MKTDSPSTSTGYSVPTPSPSEAANSTQNVPSTSSSSTPNSMDSELEPVQFAGSAQGFSEGEAVLFTT